MGGRGNIFLLSSVILIKKDLLKFMYVCILQILSYTHTNAHKLIVSTDKIIKIMCMYID